MRVRVESQLFYKLSYIDTNGAKGRGTSLHLSCFGLRKGVICGERLGIIRRQNYFHNNYCFHLVLAKYDVIQGIQRPFQMFLQTKAFPEQDPVWDRVSSFGVVWNRGRKRGFFGESHNSLFCLFCARKVDQVNLFCLDVYMSLFVLSCFLFVSIPLRYRCPGKFSPLDKRMTKNKQIKFMMNECFVATLLGWDGGVKLAN